MISLETLDADAAFDALGKGMYTVCVKHGSRCMYIYIYTHHHIMLYTYTVYRDKTRYKYLHGFVGWRGGWILTPAQGLNGLLQHSPNGNGEGSI